jgi:hypothetical protein
MVAMWESRTPPDSSSKAQVDLTWAFAFSSSARTDLALKLPELARRGDDPLAPGLQRTTPGGEVRRLAAVESAENGAISLGQADPGLDVLAVDLLYFVRRRVDRLDAGEVFGHSRLIGGDLTSHLGFIDELRGQDARNGAGRFGFDGGPIVGVLQVELQVGASRRRRGVAGRRQEKGYRNRRRQRS